MQIGAFEFVAPAFSNEPIAEATVLGGAVWLWMQSQQHRDWPLHALDRLLLPAIQLRQFVLASASGKPCFYMAWANFSAEAEARYIDNPLYDIKVEDWSSGPRMWILDWVAPFGDSQVIERLVAQHLFSDTCARSITHRPGRARRVRFWRGLGVSAQEAAAWRRAHPIKAGVAASIG